MYTKSEILYCIPGTNIRVYNNYTSIKKIEFHWWTKKEQWSSGVKEESGESECMGVNGLDISLSGIELNKLVKGEKKHYILGESFRWSGLLSPSNNSKVS